MKQNLMGIVISFVITAVFIAVSWRVPFLKKLIYGA